jgi:XTP/dITP diphosphohydrolase
VTLLVATRSPGKQREVRRMLAPLPILFPDDAGMAPDPAEDRLELGDTFLANARAKAEYFARKTGLPTVADDSGLEVLALGGLPGVRSKRWAGFPATGEELDRANNDELLRRLFGAPAPHRRARYRCVVAYDPLFLSDDLGKSFGEATDAEKDAVSHRGRAFRALRGRLEAAQGRG